MAANNVLLASSEYMYDYDYDYATSYDSADAATAAGAAFGGLFLLFGLVMIVIGIAAFIFNVWMIFDAIKREHEQRTLWLVLLIAGLFLGFGFIAAVIYFFVVRRPMVKAEKGEMPTKVEEASKES